MTNNENMEWHNDKYREACIMSRQSVAISKTRILNSSLENTFIDFHWWRITLNLFTTVAVQSTEQRCIFSLHIGTGRVNCVQWLLDLHRTVAFGFAFDSVHLKLTRTRTFKHIIIYYSTNEHKLCMPMCVCAMCVHKGMINKHIIGILFRQRNTLNVMCWDAFIQTLSQIKRVCLCVSF